MEQQKDTMAMLDLLIRPAFCIKDGVIVRINKAAEGLALEHGTPIADLLATGQEEYQEFTDGCLYLTLTLSGAVRSASVIRMDGFDVFILEEGAEQAELKAMALAAQSLREPLSGIMTVADSLFPAIESVGSPALSEQVSRINRSLFQMLRILGNMSDADRYQNSPAYHHEVRDITALFQDQFDRITSKVAQAGIDIRFTNLNQSLYCQVDAEKLERAVYNIISNAIKFTPEGGLIEATLVRRGFKLYFTVQDSGRGIPENLRSSVYSRFLRQPSLEDGRQGIGLGMVLIRAAATAHGGTVLIEQPAHQGMRITMTLSIRQNKNGVLRSPILNVDYAGEWDHSLIELSDSLPAELYRQDSKS